MLAFLAHAPFDNVYLAALVAAGEPSIVLARDRDGALRAVAYDGPHLVFAVDEPAAVDAFLPLRERRGGLQMIVGPKGAVERFWRTAHDAFGRPRAIRSSQPVYAVERATLRGWRAAIEAGRATPAETSEIAAHAARMIAGELGGPTRSDFAFEARTAQAIAAGRVWRAREDRRLVFQCHVGAISAHTAQLQGVWTPPEMRGAGHATRALGAICDLLLDEHPSLCLYVNAYNTKAIALYERVGFVRAGEFMSVLF